MAYKKKVHRFADCGSNMGAGDRSEGSLTSELDDVTCGVCKRRITEYIAQLDWKTELPLSLRAMLGAVGFKLDRESEPRRGDRHRK